MEYIVGAILILVAIAIVGLFVSGCYVKAPPTEAIVVTGLGHREPKVVSGRGVAVIPFLQRADRITMRVLKLDVKTPNTGVKTSEGVPLWIDSVVTVQVYSNSSTVSENEIKESGCTDRADYIRMRQQAAISNFLGMQEEGINDRTNDILQGNLREIVAEMTVNEVLTQRKAFASRVIENARPDLAKLGLEVVTFNVQDIRDAEDSCGRTHGVVEAIGVKREMEVKKEAEVARAEAERDIALAKAKASQEANTGEVAANTAIAENNNKLELRQAALKAEADKARVDADAAGKIQTQIQQKTLKERQAEAEIAAQEKGIVLAEKEAEVKQRKLDAEIRKTADAERYKAQAAADAAKYAAEQKAAAERIRRQQEADAALYELQKEAEARRVSAEAAKYAAEQEAEGIRARGLAEAEAIRAKAMAEAEGIEKKAEAQAKMGEASKLEMMYSVLPEVAQALASSLNNVDNVTMYGTDAASAFVGKTTQQLDAFMKAFNNGTGINLGSVVGGMLGARVAGPAAPAAPAEEKPTVMQ